MLPIWDQPEGDDIFDDQPYWLVPMEGYPHVYMDGKPLPNKGDIPFDSHGRRIFEKSENGVAGMYNNDAYESDGPEKL